MKLLPTVSLWLATSSLVAIAAPAFSQTAHPSDTASSAVGEVIVTAQRRAERVQDVPIAVSVVSGEVLKQNNFNGLSDVAHLSPALTYNEQGAAFQIRGVGTQSQNGGIEQDVAIVLDDTIQGITEIDHGFPYYDVVNDVDRIEVLEGPQGTLFGKNSSAGVLNVTTKRPVLHQFEDDASVSYGSRNEVKLSNVINIPLGDDLAFRASAYANQQDGFGYNEVTKSHVGTYQQQGVSLKLLWKPTDRFTGYLIWTDGLSHTNSAGAAAIVKCGGGSGSFNPCAIDESYGVVPGPENVTIATDNPNQAKTHKDGPTLHFEYNLPSDLTLTSITSYFKVSELSSTDVDGTPTPYLSHFYEPFHGDEFTQEIRLSSPSNQFIEYTVGGFYYQTTTDQDVQLAGTFGAHYAGSPTVLLGVYGPGQFITQATSQSYAGYGQATMHVNDHFRLIGGLRLTHDYVTGYQALYPEGNVCQTAYAGGASCLPATYGTTFSGAAHIPPGTPFSLPTIPSVGSYAATNLSGKVGVQYDVTRDLMGYFTFATGYKGPAPQYDPTEAIGSVWTPIKPETSVDYEAGIKSQWFDRRLTFNGDVFYTKYNNFQANYYNYVAGNPALSQFVTGNAGALETKGIETQVNFAITPDFSVAGGVAYIPTKYISFAIACTGVANVTDPSTPGGPTSAPCYSPTGRTPYTLFNAKGYPVAHSPDLNYNISGDYHRDLGNGYAFTGHINWNYRSSQYYITADPNTIQKGYGLLDGSIGFGAQDGRWRVSVFGRNLLDQFFADSFIQTFYDNGVPAGQTRPTQGYAQVVGNDARRTIGVKLEAQFR